MFHSQTMSVKIDINQSPVLEADGFLDYIESRFGVTVTVDKTDNCCLLSGAYSKVTSAQTVIASIVIASQKQGDDVKINNLSHDKDILRYSVPERGTAPGGAGHYRTRAGVLALPAATYTRYDHPEANDQCAICLNAVSKPFTLPKCNHIFCTICVNYEFQYNPECPTCGVSYGERGGEQPENGEMEVKYEAESLSGYDKFGTIEIRYIFLSGTQAAGHPSPGYRYAYTIKTAYLPNNTEGSEVLKLLQKAFASRVTFTVGTCFITGNEAKVVWSGIHHKTNGCIIVADDIAGYPDPYYLSRVKEELAAKGIK